MSYAANRGGHAPGHLRDLFLEQLDGAPPDRPWEGLQDRAEALFTNEHELARLRALPPLRRWAWLLGQLWGCTDTLPSDSCDTLGLPPGSSYAQAVRRLHKHPARLAALM